MPVLSRAKLLLVSRNHHMVPPSQNSPDAWSVAGGPRTVILLTAWKNKTVFVESMAEFASRTHVDLEKMETRPLTVPSPLLSHIIKVQP